MKKIRTIFKRDEIKRNLVTQDPHPECDWVFNGEGVATRKWDGTCFMIRDGKLYKRYDAKHGKIPPPNFEPAQDPDPITGHQPGWILVGDGPEDKWFREAPSPGHDGTFELVGPRINGNPEGFESHALVAHGYLQLDAPRTFDELKQYFKGKDIEGIVWHHPDGRMSKIKKKDFGLGRKE